MSDASTFEGSGSSGRVQAHDPRARRVVDFFEQLQPGDVARLGDFYTPDARFKDPFNEVQGVAEIRRIFEHMYVALSEPRFVVLDVLAQDGQCFVTWEFLFRFRRFSDAQQVIRGASHLHFAPDGRVSMHRDYWDAAEELYEKLPVVGGFMRWLKRRANA